MILIDSAAGSKELIKYPPLDNPSIACLSNLAVSSDTKSSADVCFAGNGPEGKKIVVGIEYKTLSDLLASINNGRLQDTQLPALKSEYDVCWIVYSGVYRCNSEGNLEIPSAPVFKKGKDRLNRDQYFWATKGNYTGPFLSRSEAEEDYNSNSQKWTEYTFIGNKPMKFGYLESSLLSYHEAGIYSKNVRDISQAAQWIGCLYRWWSKGYDKHRSFHTFDKSSNNRRPSLMPGVSSEMRIIMDFADRIPGIDYERAYRIAEHFDSVIQMVNADVNEWMKIPGIGKTIAKLAVETMRKEKRNKGKREIEEYREENIANLDIFT